MKGGPPTNILLELAAEELARSVLPHLQGAARYAAAMVRSAIEIAACETAHDLAAADVERRADIELLESVSPLAPWASPDRRNVDRALQLRTGRPPSIQAHSAGRCSNVSREESATH